MCNVGEQEKRRGMSATEMASAVDEGLQLNGWFVTGRVDASLFSETFFFSDPQVRWVFTCVQAAYSSFSPSRRRVYFLLDHLWTKPLYYLLMVLQLSHAKFEQVVTKNVGCSRSFVRSGSETPTENDGYNSFGLGGNSPGCNSYSRFGHVSEARGC